MRLHTLFLAAFAVAALSCNSGGTPDTLVRFDDEPAGANCAAGGLKALSGPDNNGNGALDDDEATSTRYVCNGRAGEAGGVMGLIEVLAEPPGDNCPNGGSRVEVGTDRDGDGELGEGEVTGTRYICDSAPPNDVWYGTFEVRTAADLAMLEGIRHITSDLSVMSFDATALELPLLETIGGRLEFGEDNRGVFRDIGYHALERVSLPALLRTGDLSVVDLEALRELRLPRLVWAGDVDIIYNHALVTLDLSALQRARRVSVSGSDALTSLSLTALDRLDGLHVNGNEVLTAVSVPSLRSAENISLTANPMLSWCDAYGIVAGVRGLQGNYYLNGLDESATCTAAQVCRSMVTAGLGGSWYECAFPLAYADAEAMCASRGAGHHLAWVTSAAEWQAFMDSLESASTYQAWLGYANVGDVWTVANGDVSFNAATDVPGFWPYDVSSGYDGYGASIQVDGIAAGPQALTDTIGFFCRGP